MTRAGDFSVLTGFAVNATYRFEVTNPAYHLTVYNNWDGSPAYAIASGQTPVEATPFELGNHLMSLHINTSAPAACGATNVNTIVTAKVMLVDSCDLDYILPSQDNCPCVTNPLQTDSDGDGIGDACEEFAKVGIGVEEPLAKLHVKGGQVFVQDTAGALIMLAPDGSCWRLGVDVSGNLITTQIDCPQ